MSERSSIADRAVLVLSELSKFGDTITVEMPERHALRHLRQLALARFEAALTDVEGLFILAQAIRDSHREKP
ncbi:hypothetical protein [Roseateles sp. PN1]|uniref:hypothetical protein n=1 Tax=Roseateles sp. PN1 TaxID=3137372 RepID=UPI0031397C53